MIKPVTKIAFISYKITEIGYLLLLPPLFVMIYPLARMLNILYLRIVCILLQICWTTTKNCYLINNIRS